MGVVREKIMKIENQLPKEEPEMIMGLNLNHPVSELIIEYRALMFLAVNPPDPRGDPMFSRMPPYFIHVSTKELALAIGQ